VARHAHRVTDADLQELRETGCSEDVLFEITVSAALGAGLGRLQRAYAALNGDV
jgi:alkylhydroperoxidase family enzyme